MDSSKERVPEFFRSPFVNIVGASQRPNMVCRKVVLNDVVLLLAERFIRCHEPNELGESISLVFHGMAKDGAPCPAGSVLAQLEFGQ